MPGESSSVTATRRAVRYSMVPLIALAATTGLESGERQSLSQAIDGIQHQFHVSDTMAGAIPFAMAVVAIAGALPIGVLTDRVKRTTLLAGAIVIWTFCIGMNGLATTFAFLFVFRMGIGVVEANGPAAVSLLSDYYPARQRAKMMGLYQSGALAGALIGLIGGGIAVSAGGWQWAFLMWVPIGLVVAVFIHRQPEPRRGDQDADFETDLAEAVADSEPLAGGVAAVASLLPAPRRIGTLDYSTCSHGDVARELLRIPSMWFGVLALTVSQLLLVALQFWGVPYFKRVHHLGAAAAGGVASLLGLGAVVGIVGGGFLADRYLRRGVINARVYVVGFGSIVATVLIMPAFASTSLAVTAPLLLLGGIFLTLPVAPAEALVSDVVVAQLRGRAASVRSVVRTLSNIGPLVIGGIAVALEHGGASKADALRLAIVLLAPIYAIGGVIVLLAARTYPADLAFVVAESKRANNGSAES
jgi:MFS family permease